jgi:uncharacterized membrane protein
MTAPDIATLLAAEKDEPTYRWAAFTLRAGMYASFAAMGIGLVWWLLLGGPGGLTSASRGLPLDAVITQLFQGNPLALLDLGVLLLLATPGITLLVELFTFVMARNWRYVAIAAVVGLILLLSLALSMKWIRLF